MNHAFSNHLARPPRWLLGTVAAFCGLACATASAARPEGAQGKACPPGVVASVSPTFMDDESSPAMARYLWAYEVTVVNGSKAPLRLVGRAWVVTDAKGEVRRFGGRGLVGQEPELAAGARFAYTSWMQLPTPSGSLSGALLAELAGGLPCTVNVGATRLRMPGSAD